MNVLIVGGGGREHALAWSLKQSARVDRLWCSPGNAGIAAHADCLPLDFDDKQKVAAFHRQNKIDLTVVGPELPLVKGLADTVRSFGGLVFGPGRLAARLEGSKTFAKSFMKTHGIPTADFRIFSEFEEASAFIRSGEWPESFRVVKADGLAAGKGVRVCADRNEVLEAVEEMMVRRAFGAAGENVVLEEMLAGEELSVMAFCDGKKLLPLLPCRDYKRVGDGNVGPNTGGMGAYSPVSAISEALWARIEKTVFQPFLRGIRSEWLDYCGAIYFGLMLTPEGPRVLEFNVRFGDPETQAVLPLIGNDLFELISATALGELGDVALRRRAQASVCVVLASKGYPGDFETGKPISGLEPWADAPDVAVFHAGTRRRDSQIETAGGRVLGVTAWGPDLAKARARAYEAADKIKFENVCFRRDIASEG
ncbi:MAG TPA: phosphoribosylamine--glycine ligase [Elusimicrobiota bacterium]|nr:phosphoribosylamine--glycine ligase [Elusimicrobiota bacterium]